MEQILVPTDLSTCAYDALRVAVDICRKKKGMVLHLLHTYEERHIAEGFGTEVERRNAVAEYRKMVFDKVHALGKADFLKGINVETHLIPGKKVWQVLRASSFNDIDLIVMGTHGLQENQKWFMGSNTQKVVQISEVPVLIVKEYFDPGKIQNVIFASNFYPEASEAFEPIKKLVDVLGAKTHLLKVITPGSFEETRFSESSMNEFAEEVGLKDHDIATYNSASIEKGIHAFIGITNADLVCIETHGRSGLGHLLVGSLAERVVNHADVPMLTMKLERPILD